MCSSCSTDEVPSLPAHSTPSLPHIGLFKQPDLHILQGQEKNPCPTEGHFPQPSCADQQGPNSTNSQKTIGSFFRMKKKSSPCGSYFFATFQCRGCCAQTHTVPRIQIRPNTFPHWFVPTSLAPYLSPLAHKPLRTISTKGLEPIVCIDTDSPRTSKHCPVPQLGL